MAQDIHPKLTKVDVKCSGCNNAFVIHAVMKNSALDIEDCYNCHSAYTKKQRTKTTGQAEKFNTKFGSFSSALSKKAKKDTE